MNLQSAINVYAIGTAEGVRKEWLVRERSQKSADIRDLVKGIAPPPTKPITGGQTTEQAYNDPSTGEYDSKRAAWHDAVASALIAGKSSPTAGAPEAWLLGGGASSGKSTVGRKLISNSESKVTISSDDIKMLLPEWEQLKQTDPEHAQERVNPESRHMGRLTMAKAIASKLDIIYDSTSSRPEESAKLIKTLKQNGYNVHMLFVDVPMAVAKKRAESRATDSTNPSDKGRMVEDWAMKATHQHATQTFLSEKDSPELSSADLYDNTSRSPELVHHCGGGGGCTTLDPTKWQAYQRKATGDISGAVMAIKSVSVTKPKGYKSTDDDSIFEKKGGMEHLQKLIEQEKKKLAKKK